MLRRTTADGAGPALDVDLADPLPAVTESFSSLLQECVESIKAFKAATEDFFVGQSLLRPTLQDAIDSHTFDALKSRVIQIGVMNHFADFRDGFIGDGKTLRERLKRAAIAVVRKCRVQHVERNRLRDGLGSCG